MRIGRRLLVTEFGSAVYGTRVPTSDRDLKGLFIPRAEDLLLQRAARTSVQEGTRQDPRARNTAADTDFEWFPLHSFLRLCDEGQTMALDLLFTPERFWSERSPEWDFVQAHRDRLLSRKITALVGYCRQQAARYGIKGSRLAAVRQAVDALRSFPPESKLLDVGREALARALGVPARDPAVGPDGPGAAAAGANSFIRFVYCNGPASVPELHLEVCNRKVPMHALVKYALQVFQRILDQYGERARQAELNQGVDWKALMHAVRVAEEARELLSSGHVTFPRPEAPTLLRIRKGELAYDEVAELIERGLGEIETLQESSSLPDRIDVGFWEEWVASVYGAEVGAWSAAHPPRLA